MRQPNTARSAATKAVPTATSAGPGLRTGRFDHRMAIDVCGRVCDAGRRSAIRSRLDTRRIPVASFAARFQAPHRVNPDAGDVGDDGVDSGSDASEPLGQPDHSLGHDRTDLADARVRSGPRCAGCVHLGYDVDRDERDGASHRIGNPITGLRMRLVIGGG